jgi:hypothetical protein
MVEVRTQDPQTLFYTGRVYASTHCRSQDHNELRVYRGCAEATWDTGGNLVTYKILWREKVDYSDNPPTQAEQVDAAARCVHIEVIA